MVTVAQLKELNSRIDNLKEKNSAAMAELKVLQGQFDAKAKTLSETLGLAVTADNIEALYMQAQQQLEEKAAKVDELLRDLQGGGGEAPYRPLGTPTQNFGTGFGYTGGQPMQQSTPVGFGVPTQHPTFNPDMGQTPAAGSDQGVPPTFANFGTGTTFNI